VERELEAARREVSRIAVLFGFQRAKVQRVTELTARLRKEQHEANGAFESSWLVALRAAQVTPPLALHAALVAAAAVVRAVTPVEVAVIRPDGFVGSVASRCGRALVLAALADVRASCDVAFPGLGAIAGGGEVALRVLHAAGAGHDPDVAFGHGGAVE